MNLENETEITPEERYNLIKYYQNKTIELCKYLSFPLTVQSTAIVFFKKICSLKKIEDYEIKNLVYSIILLAAKSEDIHGNIESFFRKVPMFDDKLVYQYESQLSELIGYEFHVPCPYLRMYGFIVMLQEKEKVLVQTGSIDVNNVSILQENKKIDFEIKIVNTEEDVFQIEDLTKFWYESVSNLDRIFLIDEYLKYNVNEIALAALNIPLDCYKNLIENVSLDNILKIKEEAKAVKLIDKQEIEMINEKIKRTKDRNS